LPSQKSDVEPSATGRAKMRESAMIRTFTWTALAACRRQPSSKHRPDAVVAPLKIGAVFVTDAPKGWKLRG